MDVLNANDMKQILFNISNLLNANEQELCRLDSYVGDGDHGVTVNRGFAAVKTKLMEQDVL